MIARGRRHRVRPDRRRSREPRADFDRETRRAVIPPGVDLTQFRPDEARRAATLTRLGWSDGTPVVGFLGRLRAGKGHRAADGGSRSGQDAVARAVRRVRAARRDGLAPGAGVIGDRVRVVTTVQHDDVPAYLNAMDVLCAPSQTTPRWREQFGRMLIEAFASGVAVIASDSGEIPYVVADAGVLVPEDDPSQWQQAIEHADDGPCAPLRAGASRPRAGGVGLRLAGRGAAASRFLRARDRESARHEQRCASRSAPTFRRSGGRAWIAWRTSSSRIFGATTPTRSSSRRCARRSRRRATRMLRSGPVVHDRSGAQPVVGLPASRRQRSRPSTTSFTSSITAIRSSFTVCPPERTVVTCHDLDTFRSVLRPEDEPRSALFRKATRRILTGLQRAAWITCDTAAVRDELLGFGLVPPSGSASCRWASARSFRQWPTKPRRPRRGAPRRRPGLARSRCFTSAAPSRESASTPCSRSARRSCRPCPDLHLVRVGGPFTAEQQRMIRELGLADRISVRRFVDDRTLAALYRRAALVLQPSEREGFGLPLLEAMACGTPVVASDLPVLREVGGAAVEYCPVGDTDAWVRAVSALVDERRLRAGALVRAAGGRPRRAPAAFPGRSSPRTSPTSIRPSPAGPTSHRSTLLQMRTTA